MASDGGSVLRRLEGVGASPGRALGTARVLAGEIPPVPHRTIPPDRVEAEVQRFDEARAWAKQRILKVREETERRVGPREAKLFESQALMLDDPELVEGTLAYIRDNYLSAERAFDWRVLELRVRFLDTAHAMVLDRLADLRDVRQRVLHRLLDPKSPPPWEIQAEAPAILVADEVTPSLVARLDPRRVVGLVSGAGSRGSHAALLARALGIPAVVGVGPDVSRIPHGTFLLLDGGRGLVVVDPADEEIDAFCRTAVRTSLRRRRLAELVTAPTVTVDGVAVTLQANLDQPGEAEEARRLGARGVGLFRTEFLVIGRREIPSEEEQYDAYRRVVGAFPEDEVTLRTFDLGGDKFPAFLAMPPEENPYLGWRGIRVCLDLPELFGNQLRAAARAGRHGNLRLLLPLVSSAGEVRRTRELLDQVTRTLPAEERAGRLPVGVMVETPAVVETLDLLAPHVDFVSLGTNDLTQYTLAADRGNARLAEIYDPLHPALVRLYARVAREAAERELDLGVCGELAGDPVGVCLLLGLGYRKLSLSPAALPEVKEVIRAVSAAELERLAGGLLEAESGEAIRASIRRYLERLLVGAEEPGGRLSVE